MKELLQETQELCRQYGIKPSRSKGQNFLTNEDVFDNIIEYSDLNNDDVVLEVGPGLGFLTQKLSEKAGQVLAVELDDKLASYLQTAVKFKKINNIEVVNGDILDIISNLKFQISNLIQNQKLEINDFKITANLPYNITSVFLRKIFELENKPKSLVLMLQKEVAERIVAKPGKMSLLAVSVQFYAQAEIVQYVPKNNFWPEPEVDSAIIRLIPQPPLLIKRGEGVAATGRGIKDFFRLVKFGFSARRKMLKNNLAGGFKMSADEAEEKIIKTGLNAKVRAQELSLEDWMKLYREFY